MTSTSIAHGSFSIERQYDASPARVFAAWSNVEIKAKWFIGPSGWTQIKRETTFETGGTEILHGRFENGMETHYAARFYEIIADERIVYVYDMHLNGRHHSLSLSTVEIAPSGGGARLIYAEQIAYLDGTSGTEGTANAASAGIWRIYATCFHRQREAVTSPLFRPPRNSPR
jgi:uncharacterized protein YndB with AHSA1/START domain